MPTVVGLIGYGGVGKDSVADVLEEEGWKRIAFADPLRRMALVINPWVWIGQHPYRKETQRLDRVVAQVGWTEAKRLSPGIRKELQRIGDAVLAEDPKFFIKRVEDTLLYANPDDKIVVTDVRREDEAFCLSEMGHRVGYNVTLVEVIRRGVGPANNHHTETVIPTLVERYATGTIVNSGSLEDLRIAVLGEGKAVTHDSLY